MNIHEYQAKELLRKYGVPVPDGKAAFSPDEAFRAAQELGGASFAVKAQIHAGGRGKAGGVKLVKSPDEVRQAAKELLGKTLVTLQTGPAGKKVTRLLIEKATLIQKEFYLSLVVDRQKNCVTLIASSEGGVEIETVAKSKPEKIIRESIDPAVGVQSFQGRKVAYALGLGDPKILPQAVSLISNLYRCFIENDCSLVEINPLILTTNRHPERSEGSPLLKHQSKRDPSAPSGPQDDIRFLLALDAKINFDDNGLYRHKELAELRDPAEEDPREVEASKYELSYIGLTGNIGCMVNGAGLAMATMDIIKLHGGEPANFLDVGGGASQEKVQEAFKLILADKNVKAVLVNIFGGIMKCDVLASGVVEAARQIGLKIPLVVRLEGTNVEQGKEILAKSGLKITAADSMSDAARKAVAATR